MSFGKVLILIRVDNQIYVINNLKNEQNSSYY